MTVFDVLTEEQVAGIVADAKRFEAHLPEGSCGLDADMCCHIYALADTVRTLRVENKRLSTDSWQGASEDRLASLWANVRAWEEKLPNASFIIRGLITEVRELRAEIVLLRRRCALVEALRIGEALAHNFQGRWERGSAPAEMPLRIVGEKNPWAALGIEEADRG